MFYISRIKHLTYLELNRSAVHIPSADISPWHWAALVIARPLLNNTPPWSVWDGPTRRLCPAPRKEPCDDRVTSTDVGRPATAQLFPTNHRRLSPLCRPVCPVLSDFSGAAWPRARPPVSALSRP